MMMSIRCKRNVAKWPAKLVYGTAFVMMCIPGFAQNADGVADQIPGSRIFESRTGQNQSWEQQIDGSCDDSQASDSQASTDCQRSSDPLDGNSTRPQVVSGMPSTDESQPRYRRSPTKAEQQATKEKPTEFQAFVQKSVGENLAIYGASLFEQVPSTFAPLDRVPVAPDYTVGPGDEIDVRVWGQINSTQKLVVDRTGDVFIPQVGRVGVAGLHFVDLEPTMRTSIGRVFRNFELSVNMGQLRSIQIFVMGQARRPGTYTVSSLSTLVNAVFVSGGPSPQGSMRNIQLKRAGRVVTTFDMYDLLLRGDKSRDLQLQPGDVIFIPPAGARVAVGGSVETPSIYEIGGKTTLREVLTYAGGLSPVAAGQHAVLERIDRRAALQSENIELNSFGLERTVQDGDIVTLPAVVPKFNQTVELKGNVADPVRLPWHSGMRVSEVIPEKQALLTRNYWEEHNKLSAGSAEFQDQNRDEDNGASLAKAMLGSKTAASRKFGVKNDLQPPAPDINWEYAAVERLDSEHLTTRLIAFNLGRAVVDHDPAADLELEPGDVINIFSKADFVTPQAEQTRFVRLEGEFKMAGVYSVQPGETLRQLIARAGGLTSNAYLYGAEFTRESTKRVQQKRYSDYLDQLQNDLDESSAAAEMRSLNASSASMSEASIEAQRRTLEHLRQVQPTGRIVLELQPNSKGLESIPDLPLENGDRFSIPSAPATVNVFGTVYNQAAFLYREDAGVKDYLRQAGGTTRFADNSHMFVLRADGSVVSRSNKGHFDTMPLYAGDTLMVPTNVMKAPKMRDLMDWSQVISGFGIGAAAVNVLK